MTPGDQVVVRLIAVNGKMSNDWVVATFLRYEADTAVVDLGPKPPYQGKDWARYTGVWHINRKRVFPMVDETDLVNLVEATIWGH